MVGLHPIGHAPEIHIVLRPSPIIQGDHMPVEALWPSGHPPTSWRTDPKRSGSKQPYLLPTDHLELDRSGPLTVQSLKRPTTWILRRTHGHIGAKIIRPHMGWQSRHQRALRLSALGRRRLALEHTPGPLSSRLKATMTCFTCPEWKRFYLCS